MCVLGDSQGNRRLFANILQSLRVGEDQGLASLELSFSDPDCQGYSFEEFNPVYLVPHVSDNHAYCDLVKMKPGYRPT